MSNIILSGGDLGGTIVIWPDDQDELNIDGLIYRLDESRAQAVFVGLS